MVEDTLSAAETGTVGKVLRRTKVILLTLLALLAVYYVGGMLWLHAVDDDPEFALESSAPRAAAAPWRLPPT